MSGFCAFLCIDFFARNTLTVSEFDAQIHRRIMCLILMIWMRFAGNLRIGLVKVMGLICRSVLMGMDIL